MLPRVIGLVGPEGAGKSTCAAILEGRHGYTRLPFAAPLKRMIAALGVHERHLYGTPEDKAAPLPIFGGKSARWAMQTLGTEWGRECIGAGFWGDVWEQHASGLARVVADDVRFSNEAERVRRMGGVVLCVVRSPDDFNRAPRHASEDFAAVNFDALVVNNGTLEQLASRLDAAISRPLRLAARV